MSTSPLKEGISDIIQEFKLSEIFPKRVEAEAEALPGEIGAEEVDAREDLREEIIVTIDGEKARDFDDAFSVTRLPDGGYRLKVSIADVSHFVRPGMALDREAYRRGTSTYFPDRVIPMLPERLSNDLCSLVPGKDRLTFTADMEFDAEGNRISGRFYRSVIRSQARLTYTVVRQILVDRDEKMRAHHRAIVQDLQVMGELAEVLQAMRRRRGSLDFDLPESSIELDLEEGGVEMISKAERNAAHRLIEEFMIAANEAVAEFITEKGLPSVYRIHEEPDPERVKDFGLLLHNLGLSFKLGKRPQPKSMAAIIEGVRGRPEERLINTILLRTMKQAVYDIRNVGHYGLASSCYTHFTSPIRRYPDLMVHRILARALGENGKATYRGRKPHRSERERKVAVDPHRLKDAARYCSEAERVSMKAEWASRDLAAALFMKGKVGQSFDGVIAGVTKFGLFVELIPFFVQGLVAIKNLKDDYYVFHEKAHSLVGRKKKRKFQIGQPLTIRVRGVNLEKRWVDFEI